MLNLENLLKTLLEKEGSDLYLKAGSSPVFRLQGELVAADEPALTDKDTEEIARSIMDDLQRSQFERLKEADFAYSVPQLGRFRVNAFRQRGSVGMVLRVVRINVPSFVELNLPAVFEKVALFERGIILITGTTSSGKSTSLAAIMDYINTNRRCHIVTIEDPIEYLHQDKKSIIDQRELGLDTGSFSAALKHVVRQDPDIIVIGEMRDPETFQAAVAASETGHLVFSTLHAGDTTQVLGRILDFFSIARREQVRMQLALNLRAVTCQRLLPRLDGNGLVPAVEILITTPVVVKLIQEDRIIRLIHAVQNGTEDGMQTFNQSLVQLINRRLVTEEVALANSDNPDALKMNLKGIYLDEERKLLREPG